MYNQINIQLKQNPVPYKIEKKIRQYVYNSRNFGEPNDKNLEKFATKYNISISIQVLRSMVSSYTKNKIIENYVPLLNQKKKLYKKYKKGKSIMDLSKIYNNSPMTIFRILLRSKGLSKKEVNKVLKKQDKYLGDIDKEQLKIALENDWYASTDQDAQLKKSLEYEEKVKALLDENNVKYQTQEDLQKLDEDNIITSKAGNPLTPDFLIKSDLFINSEKVNWIDAKNFYGAYTRLNKYKFKKQANKYNRAFGKGALVFSLGFSERLCIENTLLISY